MLSIYDWNTLTEEEKKRWLSRPHQHETTQTQVEAVIKAIQQDGDRALRRFTYEWDGIELDRIQVPSERIHAAEVPSTSMDAMNQAIETITRYHEAILPTAQAIITAPGVRIQREYRPIQAVGLYVPGGRAPLVSSLFMQAIPAKIAGCPVRVMCTPTDPSGSIDPHLLVAARLCGIDTLFQVGGAQAIAAMAYGTESVPKVDKVFGPGNRFVTEAKKQVAADPLGAAMDMPAGPSEVMIAADEKANPNVIAADLLAQAEHGVDSQVILLCESLAFAEQVRDCMLTQSEGLSRKSIIDEALQHARLFICHPDEQIDIINRYAPEHLILNRVDANDWIPKIQSAGTVFVGPWAAETLGDYVTGSNHVLPTYGYARQYHGLGTMDFLKSITIQHINEQGLGSLGPAAQTLAQIEGLDAHAEAVAWRLDALSSQEREYVGT